MYVPRHFAEQDRAAVDTLVESHALGILVVAVDGRLEATHVPVVLDRDAGAHGALRFHLARENPTCDVLDGGQEALVIFAGPNAYVSPDWYAKEGQVPTWNYAAVHAYGRPRPLDDAALCRLLDDLSAVNEAMLPKRPWTTDKLDPETYAKMRRAIVGFVLPIDRLQGKWKMSQNRSRADRAGVVSELERLGDDAGLAVAAAVAARMPRD